MATPASPERSESKRSAVEGPVLSVRRNAREVEGSTVEGLDSTLAHLPNQPGVYLLKGKGGEILYIGKARVLADRVRSYFQKGHDPTPKTRVLTSLVRDVETIVTRSELEALLLESNLVKRHRPRFNVVLRDDKHYPFLRLPVKENFPASLDRASREERWGPVFRTLRARGRASGNAEGHQESVPAGHVQDRHRRDGRSRLSGI